VPSEDVFLFSTAYYGLVRGALEMQLLLLLFLAIDAYFVQQSPVASKKHVISDFPSLSWLLMLLRSWLI